MTGDQTGILCDTGTHSSHMTWLLLLYREYQIGMEIQRGSRDHYLSRVVTFVARFQIENRTPFRIGYLQCHQLNGKVSRALG